MEQRSYARGLYTFFLGDGVGTSSLSPALYGKQLARDPYLC